MSCNVVAALAAGRERGHAICDKPTRADHVARLRSSSFAYAKRLRKAYRHGAAEAYFEAGMCILRERGAIQRDRQS